MKEGKLSRFAPTNVILTHQHYTFHRENYKKKIPKIHRVGSRREYYKIVKKIFEVIARNLVGRKGGVLMENFGYFCISMSTEKQAFRIFRRGEEPKVMFNFHTDGYFYYPQLFTKMFNRNSLQGFTLDRSFSSVITKKMSDKLKQGFRYKMYYNIANKIYTNKYIQK